MKHDTTAMRRRVRSSLGISWGASLLAGAAAAHAADLDVVVEPVASADGALMVALFDAEASWPSAPVQSRKAAAQPGTTTVRFADLAPGAYAVMLYHDRNGNGSLDKNMLGIPREPYGFSGASAGRIGMPGWREARFELPADGARVVVRLSQ